MMYTTLSDLKWHLFSSIRKVKGFFRHLYKGLKNLYIWRKIIFNDRPWDFDFLVDLIEFKLKLMEQYWGNSTTYQGDAKEKLVLQELVELIKEIKELREEFNEKEALNKQKEFFNLLDKNLTSFWD